MHTCMHAWSAFLPVPVYNTRSAQMHSKFVNHAQHSSGTEPVPLAGSAGAAKSGDMSHACQTVAVGFCRATPLATMRPSRHAQKALPSCIEPKGGTARQRPEWELLS